MDDERCPCTLSQTEALTLPLFSIAVVLSFYVIAARGFGVCDRALADSCRSACSAIRSELDDAETRV